MDTNENNQEQRAKIIEQKVWHEWTHQGADVFNDQQNAAIKLAIQKAVDESYVENISDEEWVSDALGNLPPTPPAPESGGTPT